MKEGSSSLLQDEIDNKELISNLALESKESLNCLLKNNFHNDSSSSNSVFSDCCSKYADDIQDMNTLVKRLDFAHVNRNVDFVFNLRSSKVYNDFNLKFRNEIEAYLFPQR